MGAKEVTKRPRDVFLTNILRRKKMGKRTISRRDLIAAGVFALGNGLVFSSLPSTALADQRRAISPGRLIDPYSVTMSGARTVSSFSDQYVLFELRRALYEGSYWLWIRGTLYQTSNYHFATKVRLITPYGTVNNDNGMTYGTGDNWTIGSQRCTPAICIGVPSSTITVTYTGNTLAGYQSKTVQIPAESISRAAEW